MRPTRATLWNLAKRDAIVGGHDMAWVRDRFVELLAKWQQDATEYRDEWDYLDDDHPSAPFEPGDYLTDRR